MTIKNIVRGKNSSTILILKRDEVKEVNLEEYISEVKPKVSGIIRIPKNDLWYFDESSKYLTHFNLEYCSHEVGKNYLLPKILESGYFKMSSGEEKLPLLEFKFCHISKCIDVKNNVPYEKLTKEDFKYSFEHIKTVDELKQAILNRYSKTLPELTSEEILSLGVSVTKLEILGRNKKI